MKAKFGVRPTTSPKRRKVEDKEADMIETQNEVTVSLDSM